MLQVTEINSLTQFPPNAILITYSDHYRGNSGDDIFLTDADGHLLGDYSMWFRHWNTSPDDRGVISIRAITHPNGAFAAFQEFQLLCETYKKASDTLKDWDNGEPVYNIRECESIKSYCEYRVFNGMKKTQKFEDTRWYRIYRDRAKVATIEKKRETFEKENKAYNQAVREVLLSNKTAAMQWFVENKVSVRNAYDFLNWYIK